MNLHSYSPLSGYLCSFLYFGNFKSFWKNQKLFETIMLRKNIIDRNVIEGKIIEPIKNVYSRSMVMTM